MTFGCSDGNSINTVNKTAFQDSCGGAESTSSSSSGTWVGRLKDFWMESKPLAERVVEVSKGGQYAPLYKEIETVIIEYTQQIIEYTRQISGCTQQIMEIENNDVQGAQEDLRLYRLQSEEYLRLCRQQSVEKIVESLKKGEKSRLELHLLYNEGVRKEMARIETSPHEEILYDAAKALLWDPEYQRRTTTAGSGNQSVESLDDYEEHRSQRLNHLGKSINNIAIELRKDSYIAFKKGEVQYDNMVSELHTGLSQVTLADLDCRPRPDVGFTGNIRLKGQYKDFHALEMKYDFLASKLPDLREIIFYLDQESQEKIVDELISKLKNPLETMPGWAKLE